MPGAPGVDRVATARLAGRRPEPGDLGVWQRWFTDPRIDEAAWPAHLRTADRAQEALQDALAHWTRWGFGPWTILERGEPIGRAGLSHTRVTGRPEVELSWLLDSGRWGLGYATEIGREAVRVAFTVLELDALVAMATPANTRSLAVMARLGFIPEGEVRHAGLTHVLHRLAR